MLDPWDDEAAVSVPWYRRSNLCWSLCAGLTLLVGFVFGWSTSLLRQPDIVLPPAPVVIQSIDPLSTLHTMSIQVPGAPEPAEQPLTTAEPTEVSQINAIPDRQ